MSNPGTFTSHGSGKGNAHVLVIAPTNPFMEDTGLRLAIMSDLRALIANGFTVSLVSFNDGLASEVQPFPWRATSIQMKSGGLLTRCLRGAFSKLPANAERLYPQGAFKTIAQFAQGCAPALVLVNDVSCAGYLPLLRKLWPSSRFVLRSHNFTVDMWSTRQTPSRLLAPAVLLERMKWARLEKRALEACDQNWAIAPFEVTKYKQAYPYVATAHLPVSINLDRYSEIDIHVGCPSTFVHIGSVDPRRFKETKEFFESSWAELKAMNPSIKCLMAGRTTLRSAFQVPGVDILGHVADDRDVYTQGRFALNIQTSTGGIKMKSLTAMAAGRTLLTTASGVEGLSLRHGKECLILDGPDGLRELSKLMSNPLRQQEIGSAGRAWVTTHHSQASVAKIMGQLLLSLQ